MMKGACLTISHGLNMYRLSSSEESLFSSPVSLSSYQVPPVRTHTLFLRAGKHIHVCKHTRASTCDHIYLYWSGLSSRYPTRFDTRHGPSALVAPLKDLLFMLAIAIYVQST